MVKQYETSHKEYSCISVLDYCCRIRVNHRMNGLTTHTHSSLTFSYTDLTNLCMFSLYVLSVITMSHLYEIRDIEGSLYY